MERFLDLPGVGNSGEKHFRKAIEQFLNGTCTVYYNRPLFGQEFDTCVLLPGIGIIVIEVKGWNLSTIAAVLDGHRVCINTVHGSKIATPRRQARGYRHLLEQHIYREFGKRPLVFEMVAYPFITYAEFTQKSLHIVSEESFTFLRDDLASPQAFKAKLDAAVTLTRIWHRDPFNNILEDQVRSLFEPKDKHQVQELQLSSGYDLNTPKRSSQWLVPTYSQLIYLQENDLQSQATVDQALATYALGTKIWLLTPNRDLLVYAGRALSKVLVGKGLQWANKRLLPIDGENATPFSWLSGESFGCFNFEAVLCSSPAGDAPFVSMLNGEGADRYSTLLRKIQDTSAFNYDQFLIEHAPIGKNVLVRAGAGTGKTHVMISRIVFLCFKNVIFARALRQGIALITFTNEATDNMKKRLKRCFQEYYLLTGQPGFLDMTGYVDNMQISTIDSYARAIIERVCSAIGLGHKIRVTSGITTRREILEQLLEKYIEEKDPSLLLPRLGLAVYEVKQLLIEFLDKLNNRNVAIAELKPADFGPPLEGKDNVAFHELVSTIVPQIECELNKVLWDNNTVHLSMLMSTLREAVELGSQQLSSLKDSFSHYLFVDEFQDTDDVQISALMSIADHLGSRLFVVGDIKQCIFRFRGADEQAFTLLNFERDKEKWFISVLNQNYRTDSRLLQAFERSFVSWGRERLLHYEDTENALASRLYLNTNKSERDFYRRLRSRSKDDRLQVLFNEVRHYQHEIEALIKKGEKLTLEERTIAVLVRENWQAEEVRARGLEENLPHIETHQSSGLFKSPPAIDLLTLVQALINNQHPKYLYALLTSNLLKIQPDKRVLYSLRYSRQQGSPRDRQVEYLVEVFDTAMAQLAGVGNKAYTWKEILKRFREYPVLQLLSELYQFLRPWQRYSSEEHLQHFYHMNVDQVLEIIIGALNVDSLTLHSLAEYLQMCVMTQMKVDCRWPHMRSSDISIKCVTIHKAKGLEFGYVVVPYADFPLDRLKDDQIDVTFVNRKVGYRVRIMDGNRVLGTINYSELAEAEHRLREETRNLYVAMTRSIRAFSWIEVENCRTRYSWQNLLAGGEEHAF